MSECIEKLGCPSWFTKYWKKLHITKWLLLFVGIVMATSGYYVSSSLMVLDIRQEMWVVCSLFWGTAGLLIIAYSMVLYVLSDYRQFPEMANENAVGSSTVDHMTTEMVML